MTQFMRMMVISGLAGIFAAGCVWLGWDLADRIRAAWRRRRPGNAATPAAITDTSPAKK